LPVTFLDWTHKSLKGFWVSPDYRYLVYQYGTDGTDWAEAKVVVLETNTHLRDHLTNLKFSPVVWRADGFFYTVYHQDDKYGKTQRPQLYYHKIGTKQEDDKLLFERKNNPYAQFSYQSISNKRYIILSENDEQKGIYNYFYIDTKSNIDVFRPLLMNLDNPLNFAGTHNENFITISYRGNNTGNIIAIDPKNPYQWSEIMPPYPDAVVLRAVPLKDKLLSIYQAGNHPLMMVSDYKGNVHYKIDLPIASSVTNLLTDYKDEPLLYFTVQGHTLPPIGYKLIEVTI
jgi:prolyl oligopeptidase